MGFEIEKDVDGYAQCLEVQEYLNGVVDLSVAWWNKGKSYEGEQARIQLNKDDIKFIRDEFTKYLEAE